MADAKLMIAMNEADARLRMANDDLHTLEMALRGIADLPHLAVSLAGIRTRLYGAHELLASALKGRV